MGRKCVSRGDFLFYFCWLQVFSVNNEQLIEVIPLHCLTGPEDKPCEYVNERSQRHNSSVNDKLE